MITLVLTALLGSAEAATTRLLVTVTDGEGHPVPNAVVRFDEEGERHRVNTYNGSWEGSVLIPSKDVTNPMVKGDEYHMAVMAPGWGYTAQTVSIDKTKTQVHVTLSPVALDMPADASPEESATYAALQAWQQADAAYFEAPTEATSKVANDARAAVAEAAHAWLATRPEGARAAFALDACRTASQRSSDCN